MLVAPQHTKAAGLGKSFAANICDEHQTGGWNQPATTMVPGIDQVVVSRPACGDRDGSSSEQRNRLLGKIGDNVNVTMEPRVSLVALSAPVP